MICAFCKVKLTTVQNQKLKKETNGFMFLLGNFFESSVLHEQSNSTLKIKKAKHFQNELTSDSNLFSFINGLCHQHWWWLHESSKAHDLFSILPAPIQIMCGTHSTFLRSCKFFLLKSIFNYLRAIQKICDTLMKRG